MNIKQYNVGMIGFGGMGSIHYKQLLKGNIPAQVIGVWDNDDERRRLAFSYGLRVYDSENDLLSDDGLDIVVIATPNDTHKRLAIAAMKAGKAVICEKPAALSSSELIEMIAVSDETHRLFTVNQNRRVNRDFVLLQNELRSGSIGTPYLIESRVNGSRGIPAGWRTTRAHGGGMLYDWGVHLIDQIMHFDKSPVVHVYCRKHSVRYKDVDDYFHLDISFEDGLTATIEVGTNNFILQPRWLAYGTDGTLRIDSWDCSGKVVRCLDREDKWMPDVLDNGRLGPSKTMAARSEASVTTRELSMPVGVNDTIEPTYLQLIDAMEGKNELTIKPEEALRVIKVIEAANRSSSENSVIHCTI